MIFKVRNYRGIGTADIELDKLALVTGLNGSGKSSTIEAIMCAATGQPNPFKDVTKKESSMLVHSGTPSGSVEYVDGETVSKVSFPSMEYSSVKQPVLISDIAAGIDSLCDMKIPDRINYIVTMMKATPTIEDLASELVKVGLIPEGTAKPTETELCVKLWETIEINGWDNAAKQAREKGTKLKGVWEDTTGEKKYGKRIAESWIPEDWSAELEGIGEEKLVQIVKDCKEWRDAALKEQSISEYEQDTLQIQVDAMPDIEKKMVSLEQAIRECNDEIAKIKTEIDEKTKADKPVLECPACKQKLDFENSVLVKTDRVPKQAEDVTDLKNRGNGWIATKQSHVEAYGAQKQKLSEAIEARNKLAELRSAPEQPEHSVTEVLQKLELAESRLSAYQIYKKALKAHRNIETNEKLVEILEPKGIRNKKLTEAYAKINRSLAVICDGAGWKKLELNENCEIIFGGVPYGRMIAKSERYRARILLQIMVACAESSKFMVIDDLDELLESVRSQMLKAILNTKIPCIAVAAMQSKEKVAELSGKLKNMGGRCYWVENSVAKEV